ncbi:MAG: PAS domain S-box protein [Chloroflexota bacterium]
MTHSGHAYIVGIGASAGGLDALEKFFRNMPTTSGLAFVIVQHLSPDFKSLMRELLSRYTTMDIHRVTDGMLVEANAIYLIPPRKEMVLVDGRLHLTDFESSDSLHLSIDTFFRSLGQQAGDKAIAIVLSGTGSDGSRSLPEIAQRNGLIIVQDPITSGFDGMPRNAIATGLAKIVCQPEEMPSHLLRHIEHQTAVSPPGLTEELDEQDEIGHIFAALHRRFQIDFTQYKLPTIMRRIDRRMMMVHIGNTPAYLRHLIEDPDELDNLYRDLLIEVTGFFRDEAAFQLIEQKVISNIVAQCGHDDVIRVWVPGCATGEEPYSIAILLREALEQAGKINEIKLFATDVHQTSLDLASTGIYSEESVRSIPVHLLTKYFQQSPGGFRIRKMLRQMVVFANHNLIQDPPFTKLDLISCRNVLIYLQSEAQQKVLSRFHFGLKTEGYLFLGPSEHIGDLNEEFDVVDRRWRIFHKRRDGRFQEDEIVPFRSPLHISRYVERQQRFYRPRTPATYDWYDPILAKFVPDGFLVNESLELVHVFGNGRRYLTQPTGQATLYVLRHLEGDLLTAVRTALHRATKEDEPISYTGIPFGEGDFEQFLQVTVTTISGEKQDSLYYLVTLIPLQDAPPPLPEEAVEAFDRQEASSARMVALERELQYTKEYLQTTIEELETANEEMQSANEELLASNEELQSTNEELHAVNEELYTVNAEHQNKIEELVQLNNDILNLQRNSRISVIFLDQSLQIRQFTPAAADDFNLLPQDVGRPVSHLLYNLNITHDELEAYTRSAILNSKSNSREIATPNGQRFMMHIRPYLTEDNDVEGVVLTFHDITTLKKAEFRLQYQSLMEEHVSDAIIITDLHFVVQEWGGAARQIYGWTAEEVIGQPVNSLLQTIYVDTSVEELQAALNQNNHWQGNVVHRHKSGLELFVNTTLSVVFDKTNKPISIVSVNRNNTEQQSAKQMISLNETLLFLAADIAGLGIYNYARPTKETDAYNEQWANILGYSLAELPPTAERLDWFLSLIHSEDQRGYQQTYDALLDGRTDHFKIEYRVRNKRGDWIYVLENCTATHRNENGRAVQVLGVIQDITQHRERENAIKILNHQLEERVNQRTYELDETNRALNAEVEEREQLQEALRAYEEKYSHVVELSSEGIWIINSHNQTTYVNQRMAEILGYSIEELEKRPFHDFISQEDYEKANQILNNLQPGVIQEYDFSFTHRQGHRIWTILAAKPLTQKDGTYNGAIATITDITRWHTDEARIQTLNTQLKEKNRLLEQLLAEQTAELNHTSQNLRQEIEERLQSQSILKITEAKFEALLNQAPTAILITDSQGNIQLLNRKASLILGYRQDELSSSSILQILPEDQHGILNKQRRQLLQSSPQQIIQLDLTIQRRDQTEFPAQVNTAVIDIEDGHLIAYFIIDITQRKQTENTLQNQANRLQRSNDELQDFAYIVSHDLRAPLRALNTYSRFLAEDFGQLLEEDGQEYISGISESAKHMDALIAGLLAYARIDRPSQEPTLVNSQELLNRLVQNLSLNDLATIHLPQDAPFVWAYEYQLQQIFSNLIDNAIKFVPEGVTPELSISYTKDDRYVTFAVADNGIGIEEKYFEKIFGIFQRLHTADEFEGTGIGLAIIKKSVQKQGGTIWIHSKPGKGSTFYFTMPLFEYTEHLN